MLKNDDYVYDMRDDDYYPQHLVQKVVDELRKFDELLDAGERDPQKIQARADEVAYIKNGSGFLISRAAHTLLDQETTPIH